MDVCVCVFVAGDIPNFDFADAGSIRRHFPFEVSPF